MRPGLCHAIIQNMEYLRFKPNRLWTLDTASPYQDLSGYDVDATLTGAQTKGISLSRYTEYSHVLNSSNYITFPQNVYIVGKERQSFSLCATIYLPDTGSFSAQQILSNDGRTDGLAINGHTITFSTEYDTEGTAACSYVITSLGKIQAVGVHTPAKNYLFINGILVDEVDITTEQQTDSYDTTDGNLYSGKLSTQNILINNVAIYPHALSRDEIAAIYADDTFISVSPPYSAYNGERLLFSREVRGPEIHTIINDETDWKTGTITSAYVDDTGALRPELIDSYTVEGTWTRAFNLYNGSSPDPVYCLNVYWEGKNATVEASIDNTTWETVDILTGLSFIDSGVSVTNKSLTVRITFDAGVDDAYVSFIEVSGYLKNTWQEPNGRIISVQNADDTATFNDQEPAGLRTDWGLVNGSGTLTIGQDVSSGDPLDAKTVEIWIRPLSGTNPTFSTNLTTGTTVYTNGSTGSTLRRGEWFVRHYTSSSTISGDITISGDFQIGRVVLYDTELSATQISSLVNNYLGRLIANRSSGGTVSIFEPVTPADIYAHDWSTTS